MNMTTNNDPIASSHHTETSSSIRSEDVGSSMPKQPAWKLRMSLQRKDGIEKVLSRKQKQVRSAPSLGVKNDDGKDNVANISTKNKNNEVIAVDAACEPKDETEHLSEDDTLDLSDRSSSSLSHNRATTKPSTTPPLQGRSRTSSTESFKPQEFLPLLPSLRTAAMRKSATPKYRAYGRPNEWLQPRESKSSKSQQPSYRVKRVIDADQVSSSPPSSWHEKKEDRLHDSISIDDIISISDTIHERDEDNEGEAMEFAQLSQGSMLFHQLNCSNASIISELGMDDSFSNYMFEEESLQPVLNVPETVTETAEVSSSSNNSNSKNASTSTMFSSQESTISNVTNTSNPSNTTKKSSVSKTSSNSSSNSSIQSACLKDALKDTQPKQPSRSRSHSPTLSSRSRKSKSIRKVSRNNSSASDSTTSSSSTNEKPKEKRPTEPEQKVANYSSPAVSRRLVRTAPRSGLPPISPKIKATRVSKQLNTPPNTREVIAAAVAKKQAPRDLNSSFYSLDHSLDAGVHGIEEVSDESDNSDNTGDKKEAAVRARDGDEDDELGESFAVGGLDAQSSSARLTDSFSTCGSVIPGNTSFQIEASPVMNYRNLNPEKPWKAQHLEEEEGTLATEFSNSQFAFDGSFATAGSLYQGSMPSLFSKQSNNDSISITSKPEEFLPLRPTKRVPPAVRHTQFGERAHNRPDEWLSPGCKVKTKASWTAKRVWDAEDFLNKRSEHTSGAESAETNETSGTADN